MFESVYNPKFALARNGTSIDESHHGAIVAGRNSLVSVQEKEWVKEGIRRRLFEETPSLAFLAERLALAASHDIVVLLTGESGTGKSYFARFIHEHSSRSKRRFLVVPCGALPDYLIQSELFGHTAGAFTGAEQAKLGKLALAGHGTLLLDEIDVLRPEQQACLLRVVETGEYEPVGSDETLFCDARIIVASNCNLEVAVESGRFRSDLYYRLNVISIHLPPLRARVADILPLVHSMMAWFSARFRKNVCGIGTEAVAALETYPWPGNIRELEHAIQQAVLVSRGPQLQLRHLPEEIRRTVSRAGTCQCSGGSLMHSCEARECSLIKDTLEKFRYNQTHAAKALAISRVTLWKKMKKYGLVSPRGQRSRGFPV